MNCFYLLAFIAELWGVMFLVWGAFHQDRLIAVENRIKTKMRKAVKK